MKRMVISYILWIFSFFGVAGLHRFYLGRPISGLIYLFTAGLLGIGTFVDAFLIPFMAVDRAGQNEGAFRKPTGQENPGQQTGKGNIHTGAAEQTVIANAIVKIASRHKGEVLPGDLAIEAGISLELAKQSLENCVQRGECRLERRRTGAPVYYFAAYDSA
jgi:TM2 domain-containing membrane protein YozV